MNADALPRPKILYVCSCWPVDRAYGGQLRTLQVGRALKEFGDVTVAVVGAESAGPDARQRTSEEFTVAGEFAVQRLRPGRLRYWIARLLYPNFVNIHGWVLEPDDERRLLALRERFDLVWFCKLRTADYFTAAKWERSIIDIDDLPSVLEASAGASQGRFGARLSSRMRAWLTKLHERRLSARFDVLVVCSDADRDEFRGSDRRSIHVVPNGYTRPATALSRAPIAPPRIGFIGLMNYFPNQDGVRWFVDKCLPLVKRHVPDVRFRLVGLGSDGELKPSDPAVDGLGWVDDPSGEIASWSVMVVPVRIGGGTRIKIAEALSRQCPLVSTRHGAYGYEVSDGVELRLADSAAAFADACVWAIRNPAPASEMATRGHERFLAQWTWDAIAAPVRAAAGAGLRAPDTVSVRSATSRQELSA